MMWITMTKLIGLAALCLLLQTRGAGAEIFQWTDAKGTLHFTDNLHRVPASIRNSPALIVRKDLEAKNPSPEIVPAPLPTVAAPARASELSEGETDQTRSEATTYVVEELNESDNIIVGFGDSQPRRHRAPPCTFGGNCQPLFRANFADRQYIHPSVFDGGSRQYIHPGSRSFPKPVRKFPRGRR